MIRTTNKSVRDLPQRAEVKGESILVTSYVGRYKAGSYTVSLNEWQATLHKPNPLYEQRELVRRLTQHYDEEPGGGAQADRIRDAQVSAIGDALKKKGETR